MKLDIDITKSIEENASTYYDRAKKLKSKIDGINTIIEKTTIDLKKIETKIEKENIVQEKKEPLKKKWYENFRWFYTSKHNLAVGGRDATSNEILIKKHMDKTDTVFHTDMAGSPFFLLKAEKPDPIELEEVAITTASFSRAWRMGLTTLDVFYVKPEQVSKTAKSGEFMQKGSFMIIGKTNYIHPKIGIVIGMFEGRIMAGAHTAVQKNCDKTIIITQGKMKTSEAAKKIRKKIGGELDDIIRCIPAGGVTLKN